jgi:DNA replication protein DnaC
MTNANNCILAQHCSLAGDPWACTNRCAHFIAVHGQSGKAGRIGNARLPQEYAATTLISAPCRDEQDGAYVILDKVAKTFVRQFQAPNDASNVSPKDRIKSLYLWSQSPGTGKTTTAAALLNEWLTVHYIGSLARGLTPKQRPAYFLDVNNWQTLYNEFNRARVPDSIAQPAAERYYTMMQHAKQAPFAVLDDLGIRDSTDGFRADLHSVINHRVSERKATVYTSNLPMSELPRVFGEQRLYDRIRDLTIELHFKGESRRGIRK